MGVERLTVSRHFIFYSVNNVAARGRSRLFNEGEGDLNKFGGI